MEYNNYYRYKLDGKILHFDMDRTDLRRDKLAEIFTKVKMEYIYKDEKMIKEPRNFIYRSNLSLEYSHFKDKVCEIRQISKIMGKNYLKDLLIYDTDISLSFNSILDGAIFKKDFPEGSFHDKIESNMNRKYLILSDNISHTSENFVDLNDKDYILNFEEVELLIKEFNRTLLNYLMDLMSYGDLKLNVRKSDLAYFMTGIYTKMEEHEDKLFPIFDYKFLLNESGLFEEITDEKVIKEYLVKNNFK
ncbi:hypothetical protein CPT_MarsHill_132 [Staphylococcus phage MarsHill]|nr:hypothetical protein CPT_MarsHill_132 [Staphylococcus phage MarsHill]QQO92784.1 hypothetical protein CPT_Madawaska_131 [Staphylococcus phage Madawaska]